MELNLRVYRQLADAPRMSTFAIADRTSSEGPQLLGIRSPGFPGRSHQVAKKQIPVTL